MAVRNRRSTKKTKEALPNGHQMYKQHRKDEKNKALQPLIIKATQKVQQ